MKKLISYFKIHQRFLLNKINIIILFVVELFLIVITCINIFSLNKKYSVFYSDEAINEYIGNIIIIVKLIIIPLLCYIWGNAFNKENDSYHLLCNSYFKTRLPYLILKLLFLMVVNIIVIGVYYVVTTIISIFFSNWYRYANNLIGLYVALFLIILIYNLISVMFSVLIPSNYAYFLPIVLLVLGEILSDNLEELLIIKIYQLFVPTFTMEAPYIKFGISSAIILICILTIIVVCLYVNYRRE